MQGGLVLRDVHRPPPPPWWPPAPGWWWLAAAIVLIATCALLWRRQRARRRARNVALFDSTIAAASDAPGRLAKASELLRRAARRVRDDADRLDGDAWLEFLDTPRARFLDGPGRLLVDGAFRRDVAPDAARAAIDLARERFVLLMERRR
ncbi:MAG TPA: DUF4381 family protein [Lysobacter sp.]